MIIQYLLIAAMVGILAYFLANRNTIRVRAWKRIALFAFVSLGVAAVIFPEATNTAAHWLGIGRGADLLLYVTVVAFVFVSLNVYLKFRDLESKVVELARAIAILQSDLASADDEPGSREDSKGTTS